LRAIARSFARKRASYNALPPLKTRDMHRGAPCESRLERAGLCLRAVALAAAAVDPTGSGRSMFGQPNADGRFELRTTTSVAFEIEMETDAIPPSQRRPAAHPNRIEERLSSHLGVVDLIILSTPARGRACARGMGRSPNGGKAGGSNIVRHEESLPSTTLSSRPFPGDWSDDSGRHHACRDRR
jgi:hypothetical protein